MLSQMEFYEMLKSAAQAADDLKEFACDETEVVLLVTPEIAYSYFVGEMDGGRIRTVRAYGYEVLIYAPEYDGPRDTIFPALLLGTSLPFGFQAVPGMRVVHAGSLYEFVRSYHVYNVEPASYYAIPGRVFQFSDIASMTYSSDGMTMEFFPTQNEFEESIPYTLKNVESTWIDSVPELDDPIDKDGVDTSELLQFLNTFNVNNEQFFSPG